MFSPSTGVLGFSTGSTQNALTILSGGNVGIGITNPNQKLVVDGVVTASTFISSSYSVFSSIVANDPGANYYSWNNRIGGGLAVAGTTYLDGNVGIGITNPFSKIHVNLSGVVANTINSTDVSVWGSDAVFNLQNNTGSTTGSEILLIGSQAGGLGQLASGIGFGRENDSNWGTYLSFKTHSTSTANIDELYERLRITANGNIGIGITSPVSGLQVTKSGTLFFADSVWMQPSGNTLITARGASGQDNWMGIGGHYYATSGSANLLLQANFGDLGSVVGHYISSTATGIGSSYFSIGRMIAGGGIGTPAAKQPQLNIDVSGNVGIGTTIPFTKLDTRGALHVGGGSDGIWLGNAGDNAAYDNVKLYYTGYNSGSPRIYLTPRTQPGSGGVNTYLHLQSNNVPGPGANNMGLIVDGSVGIGTTVPQHKLHLISGSVVGGNGRGGGFTKALFESNDATGAYWEFQTLSTSTVNDILFSRGTGGNYGIVGYNNSTDTMRFYTASTEKLTITSTGNVGIGLNPSFKLDVNGSIRAYSSTVGSPPYLYLNYDVASASGAAHGRIAVLKSSQNSYSGKIHLQPQYYTGSAYEYLENGLVVDANGNVGINTATPNQRLSVSDGNISLFTTSYTAGEVIHKTITSYARNGLYSNLFDADAEICFGKVNGFDVDWTHGGFISFKTTHNNRDGAPVERLRIGETGNVGIGAINPLTKLDIRGDILVKNLANVNGSSSIMIGSSIVNGDLSNFGVSIRTVVESEGANSYGMQLFTQQSYLTGQAEKVRIGSNGNVGIGTTNPTQKLDVRGNVYASGSIFLGNNEQQVPMSANTVANVTNNTWYAVTNFAFQYNLVAFLLFLSFENNSGDGNNTTALFMSPGSSAYAGGAPAPIRIAGSTNLEAQIVNSSPYNLEVRTISSGDGGNGSKLRWWIVSIPGN
jgi:hypothetical protein